jgi:hypothetical protein
MRWMFRYIPFLMSLYRFMIYSRVSLTISFQTDSLWPYRLDGCYVHDFPPLQCSVPQIHGGCKCIFVVIFSERVPIDHSRSQLGGWNAPHLRNIINISSRTMVILPWTSRRLSLKASIELGCKRTIFDPGYLHSLHRPNMSMNWDGIDHFTSEGIVTKTGEEYKFDIIIFATGFEIVSNFSFWLYWPL